MPTAIVIDAVGNAYICGYSVTGTGSTDFLTAKYDAWNPPGSWLQTWDNPTAHLDDAAAGIGVDGAGNVYVTGTSAADFLTCDMVTIKYDASGGLASGWPQFYDRLPGTSSDWANGIAVEPSGNIYVVGESYVNSPNNGNHCVTIGYTPSGALAPGWPQEYYGTDGASGSVIALTFGDVCVAGYCFSGAQLNWFTTRYQSDGTVPPYAWPQVYTGPAGLGGVIRSIACDPSSNVFVAGDCAAGTGLPNTMVVVKYNGGGNFEWRAEYDPGSVGGGMALTKNSLAVDHNYSVYVTGTHWDISGTTPYADYVTIAIHEVLGTRRWLARYEGPQVPSENSAYAIGVDPSVGTVPIYVTGASRNAAGDLDFATIRYAQPDFLLGWTQRADFASADPHVVGDGGCLVSADVDGYEYIYALAGYGYEFARYDPIANAWAPMLSIPPGTPDRKVKKGGCLAQIRDIIYAAKGGGSNQFWQYSPISNQWTPLLDVQGTATVKDGAGMAALNTSVSGTMTDCIYLLKGHNTNELWRYNTVAQTWDQMQPAPPGVAYPGLGFRYGSALVSDGERTLYALKAKANEVFAYDAVSGTWNPNPVSTVPIPGLKPDNVTIQNKKVAKGGALAFLNNTLYVMKGNGSLQFWRYDFAHPLSGWVQRDHVPTTPLAPNKRVRGGGALAAGRSAVYAFKGGHTREFYQYVQLLPLTLQPGPAGSNTTDLLAPTLTVSPNPARSAASISYSLPSSSKASLKVYDIAGKLVSTLASGILDAGRHTATLDAASLANGVYLVKLESGSTSLTRKLVIE